MEFRQKGSAADFVKILDRELEARGRGSITAMEKALEQKAGWWHYRRRTGALQLSEFLAILDHLGLDPVLFLRRHLDQDNGLELNRPDGKPPPCVEQAWERIRNDEEGPGVGEQFLDTMDQERYERPAQVVQTVEKVLDVAELASLPRVLSILGSSYRLLRRYDEAEHCFYAAIRIAWLKGDRTQAGNLLRRMSYVYANRGEHHEALQLAANSLILLLREGDQEGTAKAHVEQGIWLYYLERWQEAIHCFAIALERLPENCTRYRCTAFQVSGLSAKELGELDAALEQLRAAEKLAECLSQKEVAKLQWLQAVILADLGEHRQAQALLWRAIEIIKDSHYGEAALATCDLVRVQMLAGETKAAYTTATTMRSLIEPLRRDPILSAAIAELLRSGQEGLTLALVTEIKGRIEKERRKSPTWANLRATS